jgi:two-component system response regulator
MTAAEERKILLVEDNADDEALTIRALKRNNIVNAIDVVRDGAEALDYIFCRGDWSERDPHVVPQVVLLDLKLPKVGGLEVLRAIREDEALRFLPVVVLTSSTEEQDIVESYGLGANSYIRKPVDFDQFSDAVRTLGLYWLVLNETPPK